MTVKELKEQLNKYDDNLRVVVNQDSVHEDGLYDVKLSKEENLLFVDVTGGVI